MQTWVHYVLLLSLGISVCMPCWAVVPAWRQAASAGQYEQAATLLQKKSALTAREQLSLMTLRFNVAAQAQQVGDLDKALLWVNQVLDSSPNDPQAKRLKAGLLYQQAVDQFQLERDADGALETLAVAKELNPSEAAMDRLKAQLLLAKADQNRTTGTPNETAQLARQALAAQPDNAEVKQPVAQLLLAAAMDASDKARRTQWITEAKALDSSEQTQKLAAQLEAQGNPLKQLALKRAAKKAQKNRPRSAVQRYGHPFLDGQSEEPKQQLTQVEQELGLQSAATASLFQRVQQVEQAWFGKVQTGPLAQRIAMVFDAVQPQQETQNDLKALLEITQGRVIRWPAFPIRVAVETPCPGNVTRKEKLEKGCSQELTLEDYQPEWKTAIFEGFKAWQHATQGYVSFVEVTNIEAADVRITWSSEAVDRYSLAEWASTQEELQALRPVKKSKLSRAVLIASFLAPGPFQLIPQAGAAALDYRAYQQLQTIWNASKLTMNPEWLRGLTKTEQQARLSRWATYEAGHVLGLYLPQEHCRTFSEPGVLAGQWQEVNRRISPRELATLKALYRQPGEISLRIH